MMSRKVKPGPEVTGQRAFTPLWLTNPGMVAPCVCGEDLIPDEPYMIAESQDGLKRWWHPVCWHSSLNPGYTEDDDG